MSYFRELFEKVLNEELSKKEFKILEKMIQVIENKGEIKFFEGPSNITAYDAKKKNFSHDSFLWKKTSEETLKWIKKEYPEIYNKYYK